MLVDMKMASLGDAMFSKHLDDRRRAGSNPGSNVASGLL